jgi:hypothetical protein
MNTYTRIVKFNEIKSLIQAGFEYTRQIFNTVLQSADINTLRAMGNIENLRRMIRDSQQRIFNPLPQCCSTRAPGSHLARELLQVARQTLHCFHKNVYFFIYIKIF